MSPPLPVEAPTPRALADLVARCTQIDRFATQLTAAEETRIAALAAGVLAMRGVLDLKEVPSVRLPPRQGRIRHWALTGGRLNDMATPAIKQVQGALVIDEHEQVKVLTEPTWRRNWRSVALWRDGVCGLSAHDLMQYLALLAADAQQRAPSAARILLERSEAIVATLRVSPNRPRSRDD